MLDKIKIKKIDFLVSVRGSSGSDFLFFNSVWAILEKIKKLKLSIQTFPEKMLVDRAAESLSLKVSITKKEFSYSIWCQIKLWAPNFSLSFGFDTSLPLLYNFGEGRFAATWDRNSTEMCRSLNIATQVHITSQQLPDQKLKAACVRLCLIQCLVN